MACPLYLCLTSENPLKACGPKEKIGYVPSSAHLKLFCSSISAYKECPNYRLKTRDYREINWWSRLRSRFHSFLNKQEKGEEDGVPGMQDRFPKVQGNSYVD